MIPHDFSLLYFIFTRREVLGWHKYFETLGNFAVLI